MKTYLTITPQDLTTVLYAMPASTMLTCHVADEIVKRVRDAAIVTKKMEDTEKKVLQHPFDENTPLSAIAEVAISVFHALQVRHLIYHDNVLSGTQDGNEWFVIHKQQKQENKI